MVRGAIDAADAGKPPVEWLTHNMWKDIVFLDGSIPALKGLRYSVSADAGWHQWFLSECPHEEVFPGGVLLSSLNKVVTIVSRNRQHACGTSSTSLHTQMPPVYGSHEMQNAVRPGVDRASPSLQRLGHDQLCSDWSRCD